MSGSLLTSAPSRTVSRCLFCSAIQVINRLVAVSVVAVGGHELGALAPKHIGDRNVIFVAPTGRSIYRIATTLPESTPGSRVDIIAG